jgi:hypothetical protein
MAFLRRDHETDAHEARSAPGAGQAPETQGGGDHQGRQEVKAPDETQGRQDWFAEFLGDRWEPAGDGTYRLVRDSWEPPRPSGPYGVSLVDDLAPGAPASEQSEQIEDRARRGPEGS